MATREEALVELYKRGKLNDRQKSVVEEMGKRGLLSIEQPQQKEQPNYLKESMDELASDVGPLQAFLIGTGEGMYNIGRGLGLVDPASETEKQAMSSLKEQRPYTTTGGQIVGESAPFLIPGTAAGRVASLPVRALASGAVGATEGGVIQRGRGEDVQEGAAIGGAIGMGAELLFPVLGKLGRKVFQRVTGRAPKGAMLDNTGQPTPELQEALDASGMTFEELNEGAQRIIVGAKPGSEAEQVSRKALFESEGVPISRGEMNKDFGQQATEQRLLESTQDTAAEGFRQFKLKQSEAIKGQLENVLGVEVTKDETGQLIQDSLTGRKNLLRTRKNELYKRADELAQDSGGIPIITDNVSDVIPDERTIKRLDRASKGAVSDVMDTLAEYGIVEPTEQMVKDGIEPEMLTVSNFEDLRQTLNFIERGDNSKAVSVITGPIKRALDQEFDELASNVDTSKFSKEALETLKEARSTTRQLKTEFSPKGMVDRLIQQKGDSLDMVVEASKVYDKLAARSVPVEQVNRTVNSLKKAPNGEQALASLQTSILMDLVDAGFTTPSRQISGINVFNPNNFRKRLKAIGEDKVAKIFENNKDSFRKIRNIDKIAKELIPPSGAQPKGSASVIMDYLNSLGLAGISTKFPGGALVVGGLKKLSEPVKTGIDVRGAMKSEPDLIEMRNLIDKSFPGIASALGIATLTKENENE